MENELYFIIQCLIVGSNRLSAHTHTQSHTVTHTHTHTHTHIYIYIYISRNLTDDKNRLAAAIYAYLKHFHFLTDGVYFQATSKCTFFHL